MTTYKFNVFTGNFDLVSGIALAPVGASPNPSGASLSADQVLNLQPADATNPGVLTIDPQDIAGTKTFIDALIIQSVSILSGTSLQTGDSGSASTSPFTLRTGNSSGGGATTGALTLKTGDRDTSGGGASGAVLLQSGDTNTTPGGSASGAVTIASGSTPNGAASGDVTVTSGNSGTTPSGAVVITTGFGTNNSGYVSISTGTSSGTTSGDISLATGSSTDLDAGRGRVQLNGKTITIAAQHSADPTGSLSAGDLYYNTTLSAYRYYDGSMWITLATGASSTPTTEYHVVTMGEETAKAFTMTQTPVDPTITLCDIISGTSQYYSVDFTISGNTFDWNGLGLDGVLSAGDVVRLHYFY